MKTVKLNSGVYDNPRNFIKSLPKGFILTKIIVPLRVVDRYRNFIDEINAYKKGSVNGMPPEDKSLIICSASIDKNVVIEHHDSETTEFYCNVKMKDNRGEIVFSAPDSEMTDEEKKKFNKLCGIKKSKNKKMKTDEGEVEFLTREQFIKEFGI